MKNYFATSFTTMPILSKLIFIAILSSLSACTAPQSDKENTMSLDYPETRKDTSVNDTYFGTLVKDPYRWLEVDTDIETESWVKAENETTFGFLEQIPYRNELKARLTDLWDYEKISPPFVRGDYTYFRKNDGLQNQYVIYRFRNVETMDQAEIFLDPNTFSEDGTTSLAGISFTDDGSLVAYQISEGGSDWRKVIVLNAQSQEEIEKPLNDVKFSGTSWKGNEGFYYSSYEKPKEGSTLSGMTQFHQLFYHKLGTPQSEDKLVFGGKQVPRRYISGYVTEDNNYLVITAAESTSGNELYIQDLRVADAPVIKLVGNFDNDHSIIHTNGDTLYIKTNLNAPNGRVVTATINNGGVENWKNLIPETGNVLRIGTGGGKLFATYMIDAINKVYQYNMQGQLEREIMLPGLGSAYGFDAKMEDSTLYYSFTSYVYPGTSFEYNIKSGKSTIYHKPNIDFDPDKFESKQVFYTSNDGTKVPMIITHMKGIDNKGENPCLLYGYGGFNISLTPRFSVSNVAFLEQGGIYAVANLRGGGEYGEAWHVAGTKMNKQNVFDDFIAAAEYLTDNQYTNSNKLAIAGGSNGGLLVGATMTQRPNLMQVAFPAVGVLDMLRYNKFTAGAGWASDYGTAEESKEMFEYLYSYSPYHALRKGTDYPATMITTGDHDDRVVPAHSFKFAARLQEYHQGKSPVLIRIETNAGHGAGKPTDKIIQEQTDKWAFLFWNMGYKNLPTGL